MKLLLDTHLLIWAASDPEKLSDKAVGSIGNQDNRLFFSAASIWEIAIKSGLGRTDFDVSPALLRQGLLENDYIECPITGRHGNAVMSLPLLHRDPFDRMLIAQAQIEELVLITHDSDVAAYPGQIIAV